MLAQSFMTAADLGLTDEQHSALIKTLALMDGGQLLHVPDPNYVPIGKDGYTGHFNMFVWAEPADCGTVCCIGGTAAAIGKVSFRQMSPELYNLFHPNIPTQDWRKITVPQAAMALRSYLTTGDARWDLALADQDSHAVENGARQHG